MIGRAIITFAAALIFPRLLVAEAGTAKTEPVPAERYQVDLTDAKLSECLDIRDPGLKKIESAAGVQTYAFNTVLPLHFRLWKESLVRDEIILDNVYSVPDVVCQKKDLRRLEFFIPIVEILGWKKIKLPYRPRIGRHGWTARGLKYPEFTGKDPISEFYFSDPAAKKELPYKDGIKQKPAPMFLEVRNDQAEFIFKHLGRADVPKNFWRSVFDSDVPVYIAEGPVIAGMLLTIGYPALSVSGICQAFEDHGSLKLKEELAALATPGRKLYLAINTYKNKRRSAALLLLGKALQKSGAEVLVPELSQPADKLLIAKGIEYIGKLHRKALPLEEWEDDYDVPSKENLKKFCQAPV